MDNIYKKLRKAKGLTQSQLASLLYIDQTTVSKWELGKSIPDQTTLIKLAEFFNISIDYLLGRDETPAPPFDDVKIALYNVANGLSEQSKQDLIEYIEFLKAKDEKNKKKMSY